MLTFNEIQNARWDAIVVGTGIGGGTIGYALAKAGMRILFIEKGRSYLDGCADSIAGAYVEDLPDIDVPKSVIDRHDLLKRAGRYWQEILDVTNNISTYGFSPFIGEGSGGSSALYGMVMERFFPTDFNVSDYFDGEHNANLPAVWPINYKDLQPYYVMAEKLYRVRGELDPLRREVLDPLMRPPALSDPSQEIFDMLKAKGLHPYVMPMACEYVAGCKECIGYICPKKCKNDSVRVCVAPAVGEYGAILLDRCEVTRLDAAVDHVTGVWCKLDGQEEFLLRADRVILAAGALHTPGVLLRSKSSAWPDGVANRSGMVGRNLMRHYFDLYCVETKSNISTNTLTKQIAFNDAYFSGEDKLGTVQAVGRLQSAEVLTEELWKEMERKGSPILARFIRAVSPIISRVIRKNVSQRIVLTSIMEDLPYAHNRVNVTESGEGLSINYTISDYERKRINKFRKDVMAMLRPLKVTFIKNSENNERLAHACGTCRFGNNPAESVLDANNRAHGVNNLFVVDASFFPTSSGINPSLTIAANALRVAEYILGQDQ